MDSLLQSLDYRAFLRDWMEDCRAQGGPMSNRWLAQRIGIDPGFLVNILQGRKHIPESALPALIKALKLKGTQAHYFRQLVLFNRAKTDEQIASSFAELCQIRDLNLTELSEKQYRYWTQWHYPAIRIHLLAHPFRGDYAKLAADIDPPLTTKEAEQAVKVLLSLDLVEWKDGVLEPKQAFITTGDAWKNTAIHHFQDQTLELARRSLRTHDAQEREISTLTLAMAQEDFPELQELVREFRERVLRWSSSRKEANRVIQINIAAFPLSNRAEGV